MTKLESGVRFQAASKLKPLRRVLDNWTSLVSEYSKCIEDDACWWYTERANIGVLAAAAWRTKGWVALEEYSTLKRGDEKESKNGRCDLYIAKGSHNSSFAFEAKQAWQTIRNPEHQVVANRLIGAWNDAGKLNKQEAGTRVAACFIIPRIPMKLASDDFDAQLNLWVKDVLANIQWDAIAWSFPRNCRQLKNERGRIFPGVMLVLQERKRAACNTKKSN